MVRCRGLPGERESSNQFHRLDEVVIGSGPQAKDHAALVVAGGEDQDRDRCDLAELSQHVEAVHVRKSQIQQDDLEPAVLKKRVGPAGNPKSRVSG